jgi:hypothetical protein
MTSISTALHPLTSRLSHWKPWHFIRIGGLSALLLVTLTACGVDANQLTLQNFGNFLYQVGQEPQPSQRIVYLLLGALLLLVGARIYNGAVVVYGALIGAPILASIVGTDNSILWIVALVAGGLIGALIAYFAAGLLVGAFIGVMLANEFWLTFSQTPPPPLLLIIAAIVGAIILWRAVNTVLIFASAAVGAIMVVQGLNLDPRIMWIIVLFLIGAAVQWVTRPRDVVVVDRRV